MPDQDSDEYDAAMKACHQHAAELMTQGILRNGGIYVKLGQGLATMNHILPKEYIRSLEILRDKVRFTEIYFTVISCYIH